MQIAFYRGDRSLFSRVIIAWTGTIALDDGRLTVGPFVHVELIFSDGAWFSSDERDGGTRFKSVPADWKVESDPNWLVVELPLTPEQELLVRRRAISINHLGYDFWGILKTGWRPAKESRDRWFCSEACLYCLHGAGLFTHTPPWRATPVDLAGFVVQAFGGAQRAS